MSKLKIYVSHRVDLETAQIPDSIYVPVRCGAIFDKANSLIAGDDTGDNISQKKAQYSELTVLYWAWKNKISESDYIGLCHYRRFLSANKDSSDWGRGEHCNGCLCTDYLDQNTVDKFLLDEKSILNEIDGYDAVFVKPIDLQKYNLNSNYEALSKAPFWHNMDYIDKALEILKKKYPEMSDVAHKYLFNYRYSYLYNCFVMKRQLLDDFCNWIFDILFELENWVDVKTSPEKMYRTLGTIAEHFLGIWVLWVLQKGYKVNELPLLFINKPCVEKRFMPVSDSSVAIGVSCSKEYVPYLSIYLESLLDVCSSENFYEVFIFARGISSDVQNRLREHYVRSNISVNFVDPTKCLSNYKLSYPKKYNLECYFRLTAPIILSNYKKIIFTDLDLIWNKDPFELYKIDLEGFPVAVARDLVYGAFLNYPNADWLEYATNVLGLSSPFDYFNTGVLVFNVPEFVKNDYSFKLLNFVSENQFRILEQDGLNSFFKTNVKYIDTAWNFQIENNVFKKIHLFEYMPYLSREQYNLDSRDPFIIHWAAHGKPWFDPTEDFSYRWWNFARKSNFYEEILFLMCNKVSEKQIGDQGVTQLRNELKMVHFPNIEKMCNNAKNSANEKILELRSEFKNIHFPNINNRFSELEQHLKFVSLKNRCVYRFKLFGLFIKKSFSFGNKHEVYRYKYSKLKNMLEVYK